MTKMSDAILSTSDLSIGYGSVLAVKGVNLTAYGREIVGVVGPNGAGKTTLFETIAGLIKAKSGRINFLGNRIDHLSVFARRKRGVILIPQEENIFPGMSVKKNLDMGGFLSTKVKRKKMIDYVYELFPRLKERETQKANTLSGGERKMLAVGMGLVSKAKLMLVDEPSLGLAPKLVTRLLGNLKQIKDETDTPILLAEQNIKVLDVADRIFGLEAGERRFSEKIDDLNKDRVRELYMGIHG